MEKKHSLRQPARQNKQQIREAHKKSWKCGVLMKDLLRIKTFCEFCEFIIENTYTENGKMNGENFIIMSNLYQTAYI